LSFSKFPAGAKSSAFCINYPKYYFLKSYNISIKEQILAWFVRLKKFGYNLILFGAKASDSKEKGVYCVSDYNYYYVGILYSKSTYRELVNGSCSAYYCYWISTFTYQ
jgi:hypothetical protein